MKPTDLQTRWKHHNMFVLYRSNNRNITKQPVRLKKSCELFSSECSRGVSPLGRAVLQNMGDWQTKNSAKLKYWSTPTDSKRSHKEVLLLRWRTWPALSFQYIFYNLFYNTITWEILSLAAGISCFVVDKWQKYKLWKNNKVAVRKTGICYWLLLHFYHLGSC